MKRLISVLCLTLCLVSGIAAADKEKRSTNPAAKQYSVSLLGVYGYNRTWGNHGGALVRAYMPVNPYVELTANASALSSNSYTLGLTARPKFPIKVGEFYLEGTFFYNCIHQDRVHDFVAAGSFGYRMDYVNVQVGCFNRTMASYDRQWHSTEEYVSEPFNLLYRLSFNVQPLCSRWNLTFGMGNFDDMQYERMWQPLFFMSGYYDFKPRTQFTYDFTPAEHFRLLWDVIIKPTGMFHLNANFYGAQCRIGCAYKF